MSEVYPISCLACRRLKIKCNRLKSCNQCQRRNIVCEFPSTYRNTVVYGGKIERGDDGEDSTTQNLRNELRSLREYQRKVLTTNSELVQKNKELKEKLSKKGDSKKSDKGLKEGSADTVGSGIKIAGETSETGEKYYGPQSSSFMIESLKSSRTESEMATPGSELLKDEFHEKSQLLNSEMERNVNSNTPKREETQAKRNPPKTENDEMFQKSMTKKKLPYILPQPDDWGKNFGVIVILAESFFEQNEYYQTFINKLDVFDFLDGYKLIKENEWEHDDDLLLLYMILILLVVRSTPRQFSQLGLLGENDTSYNKSLKKLTKNLFFHFERLRHNLINESICTITSYILCTEWYLIEQRYEESWSMMFHTCSIAYAIGLHAMRKLRYQMVGSHLSKKK